MLGDRFIRAGVAACVVGTVLSGCARFAPLFSESTEDEAEPRRQVVAAPVAPVTPRRQTIAAVAEPEPEDLWRRLSIELRMNTAGSPAAKYELAYFSENIELLRAASQRAEPYLHFVYSEIEKRGLPFEVALLPIIESGYAPRATSPGGATGLWQIIASTGRRLGLQQTRWYDGRRDIVASTRAALDHLEKLRDRFRGDWLLAFAAYNCGERSVERAIERNRRAGKPTDFHSLDLPQVTERYVPRVLALAEIFSDPEAYGLALTAVPNVPWFESVDVGAPLDLRRVVSLGSIDTDTFDVLNPGFRTRYTVAGAPTRVLVPVGSGAGIAQALADLSEEERHAHRHHTVRTGETLSHIATRSGVSVEVLRRINGLRGSEISAGQQLLIPAPGSVDAVSVAAGHEGGGQTIHVIVAGDTLGKLARLYGTTPVALASLNGLALSTTLRPGTELRVPLEASAEAADEPSMRYEVRPGDSLWTISRRFNVSVAELERWNRLSARRHLQPGQKLLVEQPQRASSGQEI